MNLSNTGVGIDIVEVERFRGVSRNEGFLKKIFTDKELDYCYQKKDPSGCLSARFATKEAVVKALSKFIDPPGYDLIEIVKLKNNRPIVRIKNNQKYTIEISISHEKKYAVAIAIVRKK